MATHFPESIMPFFDNLAIEINQCINKLISLLNERRDHLFATLADKCEEMREDLEARKNIDKDLVETRIMIENQLKHNMFQSLQMTMLAETKHKQEKLRRSAPPYQNLRFLCSTKYLEERIACLGEIAEIRPDSPSVVPKPANNDTPLENSCLSMPISHPIYDIPPLIPTKDSEPPKAPIDPMQTVPNTTAFQQPIVETVVIKQGSGPGELAKPRGVTVHPESGHIYVTDMSNRRINIFSQIGCYIKHFGYRHLKKPWGIVIHHEDIYIADIGHHAIVQYKVKDLTMKRRVGEKGSGSQAFNSPKQLAISPNNDIYVADELNDRLQIMTAKLKFSGSLSHKIMSRPVDVKFLKNELYVLSYTDDPCIHVFSLTGEMFRSIITGGKGMQVRGAYSFCLDQHKNIVVSNYWANQIIVFSQKGKIIHRIGQYGHEAGMFHYPTGVVMNKTKLICVSSNKNFGLQIFST
ncbi:hypothetical protein LOD99_8407 [Oopsacas minuta]|uniref:Uncharacterized protein n=1 Tax=Oopsacas minuta TaxID=111878 RepID=A0AAV7JGP0_9METZ|nr:hypothetical protein LOD99_8407 [Oopsacas minuta]